MVKNPPANEEDTRETGSIPGSGRFPGVENGCPLRYSYLENSMDRGAWQATVHGVRKSRTRLSMCTHACAHTHTPRRACDHTLASWRKQRMRSPWPLRGMLTPAPGTGSPASGLVSSLDWNPPSKGRATCSLWLAEDWAPSAMLAEHRHPHPGSLWQGC